MTFCIFSKLIKLLALLFILNKEFLKAEYLISGSYLGCFNDNQTVRDLGLYKRIAEGNFISNQYCIFECGIKGYKYAGSQGFTCYCGNTYGRYGLSPSDSDCNVTCSLGKINEKCGGILKNSIFEIKNIQLNTIENSYKGCFTETNTREFYDSVYTDHLSMTLQMCSSYCLSFNSKYYAAQYGVQCWCGNSFGRYGLAPESNCSMGCVGNPAQKCGSGLINSVYEIIKNKNLTSDYFQKIDKKLMQTTSFNGTIIIKEDSINKRFKCAGLCADIQECNMFCVSAKSCTLFNTIIGILNESQKSYLLDNSTVFYRKVYK